MASRQSIHFTSLLKTLSALLCTAWLVPAFAQSDAVLVDPVAAIDELTSNQLTDIQFTRSVEGY